MRMIDVDVEAIEGSSVRCGLLPIRIGDTPLGGRALVESYRQGSSQLQWLHEVTFDQKSFTVVDVGANVGLFARQCLVELPNVFRVVCYEPDEQNFAALKVNLDPWEERVVLAHYGLGDRKGLIEFYQDKTNSGNHSFIPGAMGVNNFDAIEARMYSPVVEGRMWLKYDRPILYKSDTQGYDEVIATLLEPTVWKRVFAAALEIWRIEKPAYDLDKFREVLSNFNHLKLLHANQEVTIEEAVQYSLGRDSQWDDLVMWGVK